MQKRQSVVTISSGASAIDALRDIARGVILRSRTLVREIMTSEVYTVESASLACSRCASSQALSSSGTRSSCAN